jgi:hypothetical protein
MWRLSPGCAERDEYSVGAADHGHCCAGGGYQLPELGVPTASRTAYSLARRGDAPNAVPHTTRHGVPLLAVALTALTAITCSPSQPDGVRGGDQHLGATG